MGNADLQLSKVELESAFGDKKGFFLFRDRVKNPILEGLLQSLLVSLLFLHLISQPHASVSFWEVYCILYYAETSRWR